MKFLCWESPEKKEARLRKEKPHLFKKNPYFLWVPFEMEDGYCHWLEWVHREAVYVEAVSGRLCYKVTLIDKAIDKTT